VKKGTWSHDLLTKEALGFIRRSKGKPFFLYVPCTIPHAQLHVPDVTPYEKEDIGETTDLYAKYPEVARDIKRIMIEAFPQPKKS